MTDIPTEIRAVNLAFFEHIRIQRDGELPPYDPSLVDVVVLDMNHGEPNLGHDSLVHAVHESAGAALGELGLDVRVFSIDVRRGGGVPPFDLDRFQLFIATGGPGYLDPTRNDGVDPWSEEIVEDPSWLPSFHALVSRIHADPRVAMVAYCHSFGLLCLWAGIADAILRGEKKGGKSEGIVTCELTDEALSHPWFAPFAAELREPRRFRVLDSRSFDLIPTGKGRVHHVPLAFDDHGDALTMVELARDRDGVTPRIFAANHHPEVVDPGHLMEVLDEMVAKGEVDDSWRQRRALSIRRQWSEPYAEERVRRTSRYTLLGLLEHHLARIGRERDG